MWNPFKRSEKRNATTSGYTSLVASARSSYIQGTVGLAEATATVQTCVSLWESALSVADISGLDLGRSDMALIARSLALRGESVWWLGPKAIPASDWETLTTDGVPRAYRLTLPDAGGGRSLTVLAGEVLHFRIGADLAMPWVGTSPLRRAALSAELLHAIETALQDVYANAPLGSIMVPLPDAAPEDMDAMRNQFHGRRGDTLIIEGVAQATAAGMNPQLNKRVEQLSPSLDGSKVTQSFDQARDALSAAYGVLPSMLNRNATGPVIREGQRHLAQWVLQPIAQIIAEEASAKLATSVTIDVTRPLQAFDTGGRARALTAIIRALGDAKEAGVDPSLAMSLVDWDQTQGGVK